MDHDIALPAADNVENATGGDDTEYNELASGLGLQEIDFDEEGLKTHIEGIQLWLLPLAVSTSQI